MNEATTAEESAAWDRLKTSKAPVSMPMVLSVVKGSQQAINERLSAALSEAVSIMKTNGDEALEAIESRDVRIDSLETRIATLEAAPFEYLGAHESTRSYRKNQFVTFGGSIWAARASTLQRPGDGSDWVLAVKHGRDGRDAR